ncbi:hypothetical protein PIROE2DRAFT_17919, partial [Piromyces sp. E2]
NDNIIDGENNDIYIQNSEFKDTTLKSSLPIVSNCIDSNIYIENSTFENLNIQGNSLIGSHSTYTFNNVLLKNITTNGISLFRFLYKNIKFSNVTFTNIKNVGDINESSIIYFDSGETDNSLILDNITIDNCETNGKFIRILGNNTTNEIKNSTITNNISYGPIISSLLLQNLSFDNNKNVNKNSCGTIHSNNNIEIVIKESKFTNNESNSNGGALCFENYNDIKFNIVNSDFINNKGINGGAIYFGINESNHNKNELNFTNTNFIGNKSTYFGGAIYSNYKNLNLLNANNITFIKNYAGVAGGALFSPNLPKQNLFHYDQRDYNENYAESHGNDIATHPSLIELKNINQYNNTIIKSGSYLPLKFEIFDSFGNFVSDYNKYYSDILIKVLVETVNNTNTKYLLKGNVGSFTNGK